MQTTQHTPIRCPVLLHPAAATNPEAVRAVQQATGRLICIIGGRPQLKPATTLPAFEDFGPWGGAA